MIDFSDLKIQKTGTEFYLPLSLMAPMMEALEKAQIPYEAYNMESVAARNIPNPEITDEEIEKELQKFEENGYDEAVFVCLASLLVVPVSKDDLFEKSKLFYGPTIDPDYAKDPAYGCRDGQEAYEKMLAEDEAWERLEKKYPGYLTKE